MKPELQRLEPLRREFAALVATDLIDGVGAARTAAKARAIDEGHRHHQKLIAKATERARNFGEQVLVELSEGEARPLDAFVTDVRSGIEAYLDLPPEAPQPDQRPLDAGILSWLAVRGLGGRSGTPGRSERCRARLDEWRLTETLAQTFGALGLDGWRGVDGVRTIVSQPAWRIDTREAGVAAAEIMRGWLDDEAACRFIGLNQEDGANWFDRDGFNELVDWTATVAAVRFKEIENYSEAVRSASSLADVERVAQLADELRAAADLTGYRASTSDNNG